MAPMKQEVYQSVCHNETCKKRFPRTRHNQLHCNKLCQERCRRCRRRQEDKRNERMRRLRRQHPVGATNGNQRGTTDEDRQGLEVGEEVDAQAAGEPRVTPTRIPTGGGPDEVDTSVGGTE